MINLKKFVLDNIKDSGEYAILSYDGIEEVVWIEKNWSEVFNKYCFHVSPCEINKVCKVKEPVDNFCKEYVENYSPIIEEKNIQEFIDNFVKPLIKDGYLYKVSNFLKAPYLPKEIDNIKLISRVECFKYLLNNAVI